MPFRHGAHKVRFEKNPGVHEVQDDAEFAEIVPLGHGEHVLGDAAKVPAKQGVQTTDSASEMLPGVHCTQEVAAAFANVPAAHFVHNAEPCAEIEPAAQGEQVLGPDVYSPAGQEVHPELPLPEIVPLGQGRHIVAFELA